MTVGSIESAGGRIMCLSIRQVFATGSVRTVAAAAVFSQLRERVTVCSRLYIIQ
jgi:hypothetical protein